MWVERRNGRFIMRRVVGDWGGIMCGVLMGVRLKGIAGGERELIGLGRMRWVFMGGSGKGEGRGCDFSIRQDFGHCILAILVQPCELSVPGLDFSGVGN